MPVVVAGAVIREGALLVAQRLAPPELAGLWELPGGKVGPDEPEPAALRRELCEELGVEVAVTGRLGTDVVAGDLTLRAYRARLVSGTPYPHAHRALRWVTAGELDGVNWVAADREWVEALRAALANPG